MSISYQKPKSARFLMASRDGYSFDPRVDRWRLSRDVTVHLDFIFELLQEPARGSFRKVLEYYAVTASAAHTANMVGRFKVFALHASGVSPLKRILPEHILSYRSTLDVTHEWHLGALRGLLRVWHRLGYAGVDDGTISVLNEIKLRGNKKGEAVRLRCSLRGALSDLEYESVAAAVVSAFEKKIIRLAEFVFVLLFLATGRRPQQIGDLKAIDLVSVESSDGARSYVLNVPRRKQRGQLWRKEFKPVALSSDVGDALNLLIEENERLVGELFRGCVISEETSRLIPIFPRWHRLVKSRTLSEADFSSLMRRDFFHSETGMLRKCLVKIVQTVSVTSERTGEQLKIFPTRLRRTFATRAARAGYGELVIAELLDHSDIQNARVYVEDVPEHVDAINAAIAMQLAPLAQAFAGVLVDCESDATRGNTLASRIRTDTGSSVGTCGHYGFCGALAPIACYTCRHFQPWLDGPHQEVLGFLQNDKKRVGALVADPQISMINDRTMLAVAQVIKLCDDRKVKLDARRRLG